MRVVFTKTCTTSTDAAVWTVVDLFPCIVVPKLADIAIIACRLNATLLAGIRCLLRCSARHAKHILCRLPVQLVIFHLIVAMAAGVPMSTIIALDLHIALVMPTAQNELLFMVLFLILLILVFDCAVRWAGITWPQLVWLLGVEIRCSGERRGSVVLGEY